MSVHLRFVKHTDVLSDWFDGYIIRWYHTNCQVMLYWITIAFDPVQWQMEAEKSIKYWGHGCLPHTQTCLCSQPQGSYPILQKNRKAATWAHFLCVRICGCHVDYNKGLCFHQTAFDDTEETGQIPTGQLNIAHLYQLMLVTSSPARRWKHKWCCSIRSHSDC